MFTIIITLLSIIIMLLVTYRSICCDISRVKNDSFEREELLADNLGAILGRVEDLEVIYRNHKYAKCPICNRLAIAGAGCEGVRFICPHCETKSTWEAVKIGGGMAYLLIPDTPKPAEELPKISPLVKEIELLRNAKR